MSQGEKDAMADKWDVRSASATALNIRNMHHYMVVLKLEAKAAREAEQWDKDHPGEHAENPLKGVTSHETAEVSLAASEKSAEAWWSEKTDHQREELAAEWKSTGPGAHVSSNALNIRNMHHYGVILKLEAKAAKAAHAWDVEHPGHEHENPLVDLDHLDHHADHHATMLSVAEKAQETKEQHIEKNIRNAHHYEAHNHLKLELPNTVAGKSAIRRDADHYKEIMHETKDRRQKQKRDKSQQDK